MNCQYPGCRVEGRKADAEFKQWNNDPRPVFCEAHDEQVQKGEIPFLFMQDGQLVNPRAGKQKQKPKQTPPKAGPRKCSKEKCPYTVHCDCVFCHKPICFEHVQYPFKESTKVPACSDCATVWRVYDQAPVLTMINDPEHGKVGLKAYFDAKDLPADMKLPTREEFYG
jgi:hypothetical protein